MNLVFSFMIFGNKHAMISLHISFHVVHTILSLCSHTKQKVLLTKNEKNLINQKRIPKTENYCSSKGCLGFLNQGRVRNLILVDIASNRFRFMWKNSV
jgi:hypothetical protein